MQRPGFWPIVTIVHNSELLRIIKNCYEMLRIVTKNQMLRIVKNCYEMLRNVTICNNSTFVLEYACTIENDSHYQ
jgi:5-methylcytosine-specific restriction endonuclease McrBC regulatory subunit McrC